MALVCFFGIFTVLSTLLVARFQGLVTPVAPVGSIDLEDRASDLHLLLSGSLVRFGLHSEEILADAAIRQVTPLGSYDEHRMEILVGEDFPFEEWFEGLRSSLDRAAASVSIEESDGGRIVAVRYHPGAESGVVTAVHLTVRFRPKPYENTPPPPRPLAALVIDDLGQNLAHFRRLAALEIPVSLSILPDIAFSAQTARKAADKGLEILLHLPMEPVDFPEKHPGPGALLAEMSDEELRERLNNNLDAVPGAVGVNNHMGSRLTADSRAMGVLMEELRKRGLFFLDSKTSPRSLAFDLAYRFNIPAARRDIFLDAHDDREFVRRQIRKVVDIAKEEGRAIGIGHPYSSTLEVLEEMQAELLDSGVQWVFVSRLTTQAYQERDGRTVLDEGQTRERPVAQ